MRPVTYSFLMKALFYWGLSQKKLIVDLSSFVPLSPVKWGIQRKVD